MSKIITIFAPEFAFAPKFRMSINNEQLPIYNKLKIFVL